MPTVADILQYTETIAPPYMKEDWDNVGLLCGRKDKEVSKILVALVPFRNVIDEAIAEKADLIVTGKVIKKAPPKPKFTPEQLAAMKAAAEAKKKAAEAAKAAAEAK